MEARQRLRDLAKRISQAAHQLRADTPAAIPQAEHPVALDGGGEDDATPVIESLLGRQPSGGPRAPLVLPGISQSGPRRLIALVEDPEEEDRAPNAPRAMPAVDSGGELLEELVAAVTAPLAAAGAGVSPELTRAATRQPDGAWAQWWINAGAEPDKTQVARHVGPWFARTVVGEVSPLLAEQGPGSRLEQAVLEYATGGTAVCWQAVAAAAGVLAGGHPPTSALRLVAMLLERAINTGALAPQKVLGYAELARGEWSDYLRIACTLPDRIANRIDPQSVPEPLRPREYFAWLARHAVDCADDGPAAPTVELWTKLCGVGQTDALCVELAAALVDAARAGSSDRLALLATRAAAVPAPFRARAIAGIVRQLDIVGAVGEAADRAPFGTAAALVLRVLVSAQLEADGDSAAARRVAVSALVERPWTCMGTYQAIALALQQLSASEEEAGPATGKYEGLLYEAVEQVVVPLWSAPDLVAHAQPASSRPLTALVMMCVGALSPADCGRLSVSAAFAQAIPRFLDAPTALVRLAGVVVADCIVAKAPLPARDGDDDGGSIDFGLDDIVREAQTTGAAHARAGADYIAEMRGYAAPIAEQWTRAATESAGGGGAEVLAGAASYMRTYGGGGTDEPAVLAPRQTSLTGDAGLAGSYVRPRKPAFLRDCLAYLKDSGKEEAAERAQIALFALAECVDRASAKAVEELWLQTANRVLHLHNRGPESMDPAWDAARKQTLVALAIRLPARLGPFLADRSCDRNLTAGDRQLVLSAIAAACLQLAGVDGAPAERPPAVELESHASNAGTVVRRSRRLDIQQAERARESAGSTGHLAQMQRQYAGLVGPAFYLPLVAQYGRSDMSTESADVRRDSGQLARYLNTVAVILYTAGSAPHLLAMNRAFWDLARHVRRLPAVNVAMSPPVVGALLFGIDVLLDPARALSTPTLAREFRADIADVLSWINTLADRNCLDPAAQTHAARIVARLQEIQGEVYRRVAAGDLHQFTSIL